MDIGDPSSPPLEFIQNNIVRVNDQKNNISNVVRFKISFMISFKNTFNIRINFVKFNKFFNRIDFVNEIRNYENDQKNWINQNKVKINKVKKNSICLAFSLPFSLSPAMSFGDVYRIGINIVRFRIFRIVRIIRIVKAILEKGINVKGEIRLEGSSLGTGGNVPDWIVVKGERSCCFTRF